MQLILTYGGLFSTRLRVQDQVSSDLFLFQVLVSVLPVSRLTLDIRGQTCSSRRRDVYSTKGGGDLINFLITVMG